MSVEEELKGIASAFPYVTVFLSYWFHGIAFVMISGPLVIDIFAGSKYCSLSQLITSAIIGSWQNWLKYPPSLGTLVVLMVIALLVGFSVHQLITGLSLSLGLVARLLLHKPAGYFFTGREFLREDYQESMKCLLERRAAKLEWEWHYFRYSLNWGLSVNFSIFTVLVLLLIRPFSWFALGSTLAVCLGSIVVSLGMSRVMANTYTHFAASKGGDSEHAKNDA